MENETSNVQPTCQGPLQLLSPPFLITSTTKQMRPNGKGGALSTRRRLESFCFFYQKHRDNWPVCSGLASHSGCDQFDRPDHQ